MARPARATSGLSGHREPTGANCRARPGPVGDGPLTDIPRPPRELDARGRQEWRRACHALVTRRIITEADLPAVAHYCQALAAAAAISPSKDPAEWRAMIQVAARLAAVLGLTPASRCKTAPAPSARDDESDPLSGII